MQIVYRETLRSVCDHQQRVSSVVGERVDVVETTTSSTERTHVDADERATASRRRRPGRRLVRERRRTTVPVGLVSGSSVLVGDRRQWRLRLLDGRPAVGRRRLGDGSVDGPGGVLDGPGGVLDGPGGVLAEPGAVLAETGGVLDGPRGVLAEAQRHSDVDARDGVVDAVVASSSSTPALDVVSTGRLSTGL